MNQILQPNNQYAVAYIDDSMIYSANWEDHLQHLTNVLKALKEAGFTEKPAKCHLEQIEVIYLGCAVGEGKLWPLVDKAQAPQDCPILSTKKQV